jgi:hypothetical protein
MPHLPGLDFDSFWSKSEGAGSEEVLGAVADMRHLNDSDSEDGSTITAIEPPEVEHFVKPRPA